MRNPFNRDHYRIIVSYRYRDNFDLSYRLSIENSIWHIVTALHPSQLLESNTKGNPGETAERNMRKT